MTTGNIKKICCLLPSHLSARMGGAEYQVKLIMDALKNKGGYEIHYLCRNFDPTYVPNGYKIHKVGSTRGLSRYGFIFNFRSLYRTLKEINPQIIYQRVGCAYTGIAALYAMKHGAKLIWHISSDNDVIPYVEPNIKRRLRYTLERLFLNYGIRHADIIIGQTLNQDKLLQNRHGRQCDVIIPNGHHVPDGKIEKAEQISVMLVSNMKPIKQPEIFVRLARKLGEIENVSFVMMGRLSSGKWFKRLLDEIDIVPNLEYLGEVSNDEVNRRLSEGHILVNTSLYEGLSNTFIQAWMRRVPVVSLNVDPDGVLVREGLGFRSGSFERLRHDVERLICDHNLREEMGNRAMHYSIENYSVKDMITKFTELFESVIEAKVALRNTNVNEKS